MPDINKCPVCGSEMQLEEERPWYRLRCTGCPLDFGRYWFECKDALIRSWNNWSSKDIVKTDPERVKRMRELNNKPNRNHAYEKLFMRR